MTVATAPSARRVSAPKSGSLREPALRTVAAGNARVGRRTASSTGKAALPIERTLGKLVFIRDLSGVERHQLVKGGLSTQAFREALEAYIVVSESELLHAVGLSTKTLGRREDTKLGPRHSDAALALLEVTDIAVRVLGNRKLAEQWLKEPSLALDGGAPLDLISTAPGIETVKDLLTRMEYGVYA